MQHHLVGCSALFLKDICYRDLKFIGINWGQLADDCSSGYHAVQEGMKSIKKKAKPILGDQSTMQEEERGQYQTFIPALSGIPTEETAIQRLDC